MSDMSLLKSTHLHILLVDDNDQVRDSIARLLEAEGHTVEAVGRAKAALAIFQASKFHLVITDFSMPEMNGEALASAIKAISPTQRIVLVTALAARATHRPLLHVDYLLPKPFTVEDLHRALAALFSPEGGQPKRSL